MMSTKKGNETYTYTNYIARDTYIYIKESWTKTHINYGNVWDATKGYRGEGPEEHRGKKNSRQSVARRNEQ